MKATFWICTLLMLPACHEATPRPAHSHKVTHLLPPDAEYPGLPLTPLSRPF